MRVRATFAITTVLIWGPGIGMSRSAVTKGPRPAIALRVVDESARVPPRTLSLAKKDAVRIFAQAGIDLTWLNCDPAEAEWGSANPCYQDRGPTDFWLPIVMRKPATTSCDALGFAEIDECQVTGSAGIYYPAVKAITREWHVREGEILAAAIAHGSGHLILGANAHSLRGVMQANWGGTQYEAIAISELNFAPKQTKALREHIENRMLRTAAPTPERNIIAPLPRPLIQILSTAQGASRQLERQ